jgi:hypothetical protein
MLGLGASLSSPYGEGVVHYLNTKSLDGDFTGDNGVNTNYDPQTLLRGAHSFSMWLKPDDGLPSTTQNIFGVSNGSADIYYMTLNAQGKLTVFFYANGTGLGNISIPSTNSAVFTDGAQSDFTHIAIIQDYSGSNVELTIYVNGSAVDHTYLGGFKVSVAQANQFDSNGIEMAIDGYSKNLGTWDIANGFDGLIDEFAAFTKALSASEVSDIYNSGTPKDESGHDGLELYYRFEDDLTDTAGTSDASAEGTVTFSSTTP